MYKTKNKISFIIKKSATLPINDFFALSSQGNSICCKQEKKTHGALWKRKRENWQE